MRTKEHNRKIGDGQRRAWSEGRRKCIPIGSKRIKNGKLQIKVLSVKGWKFWKYERVGRNYSNLSTEELLKLPTHTKVRLRKKGVDIPKFSPGVKRGYKQSLEWVEKKRQSLRKYLFDLRTLDQEAKERIRKSIEYTQWRLAVFVRDNWTCQKCGARNGEGEEIYLEAHHIKSYTKHPELRFKVSNGLTFCLKCHRKENAKQMRNNKNGQRKLAPK